MTWAVTRVRFLSLSRGTLINMTSDVIEMALLGRQVVEDGRLRQLRDQLGFSVNVMSEVLYMNAVSYRRWESGGGAALKPSVAERLGRFYVQAIRTLDLLSEQDLQLRDLVPFHLVAGAAGLPHEILLQRCRRGHIDGVDLGILGTWLHRADLDKLSVSYVLP